SRLSYRRRFRRPFEVALLIRTCDYWASFQHFLHQILATATRARFGYRLTGGGELALGIICAAVECVSFARLLFNQVAFLTERALHSNEILLHIFAVGITAAGRKLPKAPVPDHHVASALRAEFIERNVGNFLSLVEPASGLAVRIAGAGHELAEAPSLQHHDPAAIFAILFLGGFLDIGRIQVRQVDRIFLGESATIGIFFVVGAASIERTVLAPLDHQRRATALALLVRGLLHPLDVLHVLLGVAEVLGEALVELGERIG